MKITVRQQSPAGSWMSLVTSVKAQNPHTRLGSCTLPSGWLISCSILTWWRPLTAMDLKRSMRWDLQWWVFARKNPCERGSLLFALHCKRMQLNVMGLSEKQIKISRHKIPIHVTQKWNSEWSPMVWAFTSAWKKNYVCSLGYKKTCPAESFRHTVRSCHPFVAAF